MTEDNQDFEVNLADAVRKYPSLYDKTSKLFKDTHVKNLAWGNVANELNLKSGLRPTEAFQAIWVKDGWSFWDNTDEN